jgi:predicted PurR-regulated permease PerM
MVVSVSRAIVGSTLTIAWNLAVIIVVSFFLIRDGSLIIGYLTDIIPLPSGEREAFFRRAKEILQAVVYGVIVTAFVQGILGAAGWWYAGLRSPMFFGAMMMLLAMIPFVGTALLWGPAGIYLLYAGKLGDGIFILLWGAFVVSMADNLIRPLFISGGAKLHLLTVFIGVLGGLAAWGFLGLFMGPLVISLFFFLLESYRTMWKGYLASPSRVSAGSEKNNS